MAIGVIGVCGEPLTRIAAGSGRHVVGWHVGGLSDGGGSSNALPQGRCSRIAGVRASGAKGKDMSIWSHDEVFSAKRAGIWDPRFETKQCIHCKSTLRSLGSTEIGHRSSAYVEACPVCGWWRYREAAKERGIPTVWGTLGGLRELDMEDVSVPLGEAMRYLIARYEERNGLSPKLFEEVVGSVFASLGFVTEVTAYSGDGGIDIFMRRNDVTIGVQVKRTKNSVEAEQIRALVGALVLHGLTDGVFVTTSRFRSGAQEHVERYASGKYLIELVDAEHLFELLKISQRPMYRDMNDFPVDSCRSRLGLLSADFVEDMLADPDF